ncbi:Metallo-dependent phosphatase-like protein, partial [Cytidiella melzeri]
RITVVSSPFGIQFFFRATRHAGRAGRNTSAGRVTSGWPQEKGRWEPQNGARHKWMRIGDRVYVLSRAGSPDDLPAVILKNVNVREAGEGISPPEMPTAEQEKRPRPSPYQPLVLRPILWYELAAFSYQVSQCPWPVIPRNDPTGMADVAEPAQVDLNMRKSWWATKQLHPDVIIFLGDMMDGGQYAMSDDEYESYLRRTKDMFAIDESTPVYYLTGNHDVGIGSSDEWSKFARDRWLSHFGPLQQRLKIANHTLVLLDAPGLVEEERKRVVSGMSFPCWTAANPNGPIAFAQQSAEVVHSERHPTVLLTHIPLFRPRDTSCGPLREHGTIREGSGYGYQNTLDYLVSNMHLEGIRPSVIFSGDDHDYCEVHHPIRPSDDIPLSELHSVKEVSVKSFSMAMGIRRPGYPGQPPLTLSQKRAFEEHRGLAPSTSASPQTSSSNSQPQVASYQRSVARKSAAMPPPGASSRQQPPLATAPLRMASGIRDQSSAKGKAHNPSSSDSSVNLPSVSEIIKDLHRKRERNAAQNMQKAPAIPRNRSKSTAACQHGPAYLSSTFCAVESNRVSTVFLRK